MFVELVQRDDNGQAERLLLNRGDEHCGKLSNGFQVRSAHGLGVFRFHALC